MGVWRGVRTWHGYVRLFKSIDIEWTVRRLDHEFSDELVEKTIEQVRTTLRQTEGIPKPHVNISGKNLVLRTRTMRIMVDPTQRSVQVDGRNTGIETNFGPYRFGWFPTSLGFFRITEKPEKFEWIITKHVFDNVGNHYITFEYRGQIMQVNIDFKHNYVWVIDGAIKALLGQNYFMIGPNQLQTEVKELQEHKRPRVVQFQRQTS